MHITKAQGNIHFVYDATGCKWAKSAYVTAPADESGPDGARFYAGNIEYLDGKIQHIAFADGRLVAEYDENGIFLNKYRAEYFRTDHLGNTRSRRGSHLEFTTQGVVRLFHGLHLHTKSPHAYP